jgi:hypothetical protein
VNVCADWSTWSTCSIDTRPGEVTSAIFQVLFRLLQHAAHSTASAAYCSIGFATRSWSGIVPDRDDSDGMFPRTRLGWARMGWDGRSDCNWRETQAQKGPATSDSTAPTVPGQGPRSIGQGSSQGLFLVNEAEFGL